MNNNKLVNPERKWIRLQEIGLCLALAIPVSIAVIAYFFGYIVSGTTASRIINVLVMLFFSLGTGSYVCFRYGAEERQKLKDKRLEDEKMQKVWAQRR